MNDKTQSYSRCVLFVGLVVSLASIMTGCSMLSKGENKTTEVAKPKQWYECTSNDSSPDWNCGSDSNSSSEAQTIDAPARNEPVNKKEISNQEISKEEAEAVVDKAEKSEQLKDEELETGSLQDATKSNAKYTIQLGAFAGKTKRDSFVENHGLQKTSIAFYESIKDERTWWVITSGEFADIADAHAANNELAQKYGLNDTWVRPLDQLKPQPTLIDSDAPDEIDTGIEIEEPASSNIDDERF